MSNDIPSHSPPRPESALPAAALVRAAQAPRAAATPAAAPEAQAAPKPDPKELRRRLEEASNQLNTQMAQNKRDLSFSVDAVANKIVLTVKDSQGEVVRQIPSETALKLAQNLIDIKGLLQDGRT